MKFAVLILASFGSALGLSPSNHLHGLVHAKSEPEPANFWSCKNANVHRSGSTEHIGPHDLSQNYSWVFEEPIGYGAFEATPVLDGHYSAYIGSTAGGFFGIRRDGSLLWSRRLPGRVMTPTLDSGVLYLGTSQGWAFAIDAATGEDVWKRQIATVAGGDAWTVTLVDDTVITVAETVYNDGNGRIFGLDASNGSERWSLELKHTVYNFMPVVLDDSIIFMDKLGGMYRVSAADGRTLWYVGMGEGSFATGGLALGLGSLVFATSNQNGSTNGTVHAHSVEDGSLKWVRTFDVEAAAAPAVLSSASGGPAVVVGLGANCAAKPGPVHTGRAVALSLETGAELWSFEPPTYHGYVAKGVERGFLGPSSAFSLPDTWSNPAIGGDGTVYVGWHGGLVFALDGRTGKEVSRHDVGCSFQGQSAIAPGYLVVPSLFRVVAFDDSR